MPPSEHAEQLLLRAIERERECRNADALVEELQGRDWSPASELLSNCDMPDTEANRRWIRAMAAASGGRVAGGQRGYKLVREMTGEEYNHWRNWMKSQADEMTRRILESDKVFYGRQEIRTGNGILETD